MRTEKSCGPDAPTLVSSSVGSFPAGRRWQESPVTGESTKEAVKTIAQGRPGYSGEPVVTMLVCFIYFAREAAGAAGTRLSLRPLFLGRTVFPKPERIGAAGGQMHGYRFAGALLSVVPANAGTHTARCFGRALAAVISVNHRPRGLWVPAFAGTTKPRNPRHPHHILHKYQACTASAWPPPPDMVSRQRSLDRHR